MGLRGENADGGGYAPAALAAGAWGVLVGREHGERAAAGAPDGAAVLEAGDPLAALQSLARAWRRELGSRVVGVTGSTGKTSTKDILAALLSPRLRTHRNRENLNTEIGLPLTILEAPEGTEALVLEMAMRGEGQIAELVGVAEPDCGVIVNVGPVHLELLGTVERVAAAKAELIRDLPAGATCVVPAAEPLLDAHLRDDLDTVTFGPGGQVQLLSFDRRGRGGIAEIEARGEIADARARLLRAVQPAQHARRRGRGDGASGCARRAGSRRSSHPCEARSWSWPAASRWSTTPTTPTRCRCGRLSSTSPRRPPIAGWPCSARWPSWARARRPSTATSARRRRRWGSTC